jgi:Fe-S-cluster-containing hydrogenase component 2
MTKGKKEKSPHETEPKADGLGKDNLPYPTGPAHILCDEMKCVGCGICQMACSMKHYGVINKDLARIQVHKYLLPLPKAIQVTCIQCEKDAERQCENACPVSPPAIFFNKESQHMVIDEERCLGEKCLQCQKACSINAIRIYPSVSPTPFVCDLCDTENTGDRRPECVDVCPYSALQFVSSLDIFYGISAPDLFQISPNEKADLIAKRLYPLDKKNIAVPGWR